MNYDSPLCPLLRYKVTGLRYSTARRALISTSEDKRIIVWDMSIRREQVKYIVFYFHEKNMLQN